MLHPPIETIWSEGTYEAGIPVYEPDLLAAIRAEKAGVLHELGDALAVNADLKAENDELLAKNNRLVEVCQVLLARGEYTPEDRKTQAFLREADDAITEAKTT